MPRSAGSGGDKKQRFVDAIVSQKLEAVRWGVANAGVAPATRLQDEMTSFMIACAHGKDRSLAELIRWYERRLNQLRECLEQVHAESGKTAMHLACGHANGLRCVDALLEAWQRIEPKRLDAGVCGPADSEGKRPIDYAKGKTLELIESWTTEPETDDEEEEEDVGDTGLTSTQRNKLKKKALEANERRGTGKPVDDPKSPQHLTDEEERGEVPNEMPTPTWPEVQAWVDSVKKLRPICELSITRDETDSNESAQRLFDFGGEPPTPIDPALWYCKSLNRLQLKLGSSLETIHAGGLAKLANLSTLILAGNSLFQLPDSIATLPLKSLDASRNRLAKLPEIMPVTVESIDLSQNDLESIAPLRACEQLVSIAVDANPRLAELVLDFEVLKRLVHLSASACNIVNLPPDLGALNKLENLVLSDNPLVELPASLANCKKLKSIKIDRTDITDNKVAGYVQRGEMKQLAKYWEKNTKPKSKPPGKKGKR